MSFTLLTQRGNDIDGEAAGDAFGTSVSISEDGTVVAIGADPNNSLTLSVDTNSLINLKEGKILRIKLKSNSAFINRAAFTKVDYDPLTGTSINGQKAENSAFFRRLAKNSLTNPNDEILKTGGDSSRTIFWEISSDDAGLYTPVLITQTGELITLGSAADNRDHVLLKHGDTLCFEDLMSYQNSDWDYNDLTVRMTEI